jgi:hypothetical protein
MTKSEVINKFKTLSPGQYSESVLDKMAMTFTALCTHADFSASVAVKPAEQDQNKEAERPSRSEKNESTERGLAIQGLVYNIQLRLPESGDRKVYDALFDSLKRHLI